MINFKEYLTEEINRSTDEAVKDTVIRKIDKEMTLDDVKSSVKPDIWTAKEINGVKYLFYNNKILNISQLKKEINNLYDSKGYKGYGFSKLSESELVRYTKVKDILISIFTTTIESELKPDVVAEKLFINELKEYDWKPEEY